MIELKPHISETDPSYVRSDGLSVLILDKLKLAADFNVVERSFITFPPGAIGGNHKHPRTEVFLTTQDLTLYWISSEGVVESESMSPTSEGKIKVFVIPPYLPHAVRNNSIQTNVMFEFANSEQKEVEMIEVIK